MGQFVVAASGMFKEVVEQCMSKLPAASSAQTVPVYAGADAASYDGPGAAFDSFTARDVVRLFERHKLMILLIVGITSIAVLIQQLLAPAEYLATAHAQVELIDEVGANQADIDSRNVQRVANAVRLHRSRSAAERVIRDLDLMDNPAFRNEIVGEDLSGKHGLQVATNRLLKMVSFTSEEGSDLIEIAVTAKNPRLAAEIANQYPSSVRALRDLKSDERRKSLLVSLIEERERRSDAAEIALRKVADFRTEYRMLEGAGGPEDYTRLNDIAAQAAAASANQAGSAARSAAVARAARMRSTAQATSPALQQFERSEADLIAEQARLSSTFGPNHPDIVRVNAQLDTVRQGLAAERARAIGAAAAVAGAEGAQMAELARSEAANEAARAGVLQGVAASMASTAYRNATQTVKLSELEREATLAEKAYNDIAERVEQVRAQTQMEGVSSSIVSPAVANYDAVAPRPVMMTLITFLGSGALALLLAFGWDLIDDKLRNSAQIRRYFGLPTFGMLPIIGGGFSNKNFRESPVIQDPQSLFAEVARSTYSEVRALNPGAGGQSILITSPLPGDGKSTVSLTLAAAATAFGHRAVVVDLDLRNHSVLQAIQNDIDGPDIVDVISGRVDLANLLSSEAKDRKQTEDRSDGEVGENHRIVLLSAKRPVRDPAAVLSGKRLNVLLEELRTRFDLIVINAPAALPVRDARSMCDYTDHTLVVARWGSTTIDQMNATLEALSGQASGVVFDQVDYADHARRCYGDSIQFYVASSAYYSDTAPARITLLDQLRRLIAWRPAWARS